MSLAAGDLLDDKYRLSRRLGEGGMGTVWLAEDTQLGREVAVKVLGQGVKDSVANKRFMREARTAAQLRSPHVAQVFDFGIHDEHPYIVMERLDGEDLEERLTRGPLTPEAVAVLVDGACVALSEAHSLGIVHRDLKPANLFFTRVGGREVVKVLDFGIATRRFDSGPLTMVGTVIGTPLYMSPEQSQGKEVDHKSDLWSIAVVAYEALTTIHPFAGKTDWESLAAIMKRPVPPPTTLSDGLPKTLDDFFQKALRRAPAQRFSSAEKLAAAFVATAQGEPLPEDIATLDTALVESAGSTRVQSKMASSTVVDTDVVAVGTGRTTLPVRRGSIVLAILLLPLAAAAWFAFTPPSPTSLRAKTGLVPTLKPLAQPAAVESAPLSPPPLASSSKAPPKPPEKGTSTRRPPVRLPIAKPPPPALQPQPKPKPDGNEFGIE